MRLLMTMTGVGFFTAMLVVSEVGDVGRFRGDKERAGKVYQGLTPLCPDDIADAVVYCATRPPHVNISAMIVMPTDQASPTLVHRR